MKKKRILTQIKINQETCGVNVLLIYYYYVWICVRTWHIIFSTYILLFHQKKRSPRTI